MVRFVLKKEFKIKLFFNTEFILLHLNEIFKPFLNIILQNKLKTNT
jgi:hypothetical protein